MKHPKAPLVAVLTLLIGGTAVFAATPSAVQTTSPGAVTFPECFPNPIIVGTETVYTQPARCVPPDTTTPPTEPATTTPTTVAPTTTPPTVPPTTVPPTAPPNAGCGLTAVAFCDTFTTVGTGGREADLDPAKWSVGRVVGEVASPSDVQPFPSTPVAPCKTGVTTATVDHDVLACNITGRSGQIETALAAQNYGLLSMRPRQAFDFAGRTGTVAFNVDAVTTGILGTWTSVFITDDPTPAASNSAEVLGYLPRNGLGVSFNQTCSTTGRTGISVYSYTNTVETDISPTSPTCFTAAAGTLNHIELRLSQTALAVWASDAGGSNFRQIFTTPLALPFSRGYVHFQAAERAPVKYGLTPKYSNVYWSALGFDGPVIGETAVQVPDALTSDGARGTNVGYPILPSATVTIPNVPAGLTSAILSFALQYTFGTSPTLQYSVNGGPAKTPSPAPDIAAEQLCTSCPGAPAGGSGVPYVFPIDVTALHAGSNTVTFTATGQTGSWPFHLSNIDLIYTTGGVPSTIAPSTIAPTTAPPPPTTSPSTTPPTTTAVTGPSTTPNSPACSLPDAAFCETFDAPHNGGTRTGDLDPILWGVSRVGQSNDGNGQTNRIPNTHVGACGSTASVAPPNDVRVCGGKLFDSVNDGHEVENLDMYPKQPFDFAGRTGTVTFDVSADSEGPHGAWPELVITDKPVPGIRSDISNTGGTSGNNDVLPPAAVNEVGIAFDGGCLGQANTTGVGEIYVDRNGAFQEVPFTDVACVTKGTLTSLNHFEVRISQDHLEVWGTDPGSSTLHQLAIASNLGLTLTRGLVWINDVHYNACKFPNPNGQCEHTFAWDNLGYDGPKTYRDLGFDVPDANRTIAGSTDEGFLVGNGTITLQTAPARHDVAPTGAQVVFNFWVSTVSIPSISVNGNAFIVPAWPFADRLDFLWRTISIPVPLGQVRDGVNTIAFRSTDGLTQVANVSLILVAAAVVP